MYSRETRQPLVTARKVRMEMVVITPSSTTASMSSTRVKAGLWRLSVRILGNPHFSGSRQSVT